MPDRYLGRTLGKFRIDALAGSGGFAWVFKAWDPELEIPVALKVLKPQYAGDEAFEQRFRREASMAARLRHPNIVKIFAVGREGDAVYFAMDYLPHGLADRLELVPTLPEDVLVRLGVDVASALGFAHREGVIHRDIKVDNIMFDDHGNAVVADFGIARAVQNFAEQTGTNMVVGTPQYFSPEQARGQPLDGRADIYSLGVTLFRAATGTLPFNGDDWYEIARQHVEERPPSLRALNRALSRDFERVVLRCLAKDPADRYATAEDLGQALAATSAGHGPPSAARTLMMRATSAPVPPRYRRMRDVPRAIWAGAAVAFAFVGALLYVDKRGESAPRPQPPAPVADGPEPDEEDSVTADSVGEDASDAELEVTDVPAPRPRPPVLSVRTVPGAAIRVNNIPVGRGTWRSDTLVPGRRYVLSATVGTGPAGCRTNPVVRAVTAPPSGTRVVELAPRPCGALRLDIKTVGARYTVRSATSGDTLSHGPAPASFPLVLPAGAYQVQAEAPSCAQYATTVNVAADSTTSLRVRLICDIGERDR